MYTINGNKVMSKRKQIKISKHQEVLVSTFIDQFVKVNEDAGSSLMYTQTNESVIINIRVDSETIERQKYTLDEIYSWLCDRTNAELANGHFFTMYNNICYLVGKDKLYELSGRAIDWLLYAYVNSVKYEYDSEHHYICTNYDIAIDHLASIANGNLHSLRTTPTVDIIKIRSTDGSAVTLVSSEQPEIFLKEAVSHLTAGNEYLLANLKVVAIVNMLTREHVASKVAYHLNQSSLLCSKMSRMNWKDVHSGILVFYFGNGHLAESEYEMREDIFYGFLKEGGYEFDVSRDLENPCTMLDFYNNQEC
tara:strand:- start:15622 stop:16542 length:921 start_codon:yes stop_codon:yes gene_type:complete